MIELVNLAKKFIGKNCIIRTFTSSSFSGKLKEVSDSTILIESNTNIEVINLEFVVSIQEHPRNKKGKLKAIF